MDTKGRTVLITGTSSGFGKSTTEILAREGWNVVATLRNPADGKHFSAFPNVLVTGLDVTDEASIAAAIAVGIARFGKIDAVVNNAGGLVMGIFEAVPDAKVRELFETNTFGVMNVTRQILPHFRQQGRGLVVNVTSAVALAPLPMFSIYAASKYAIEGFSEALAYELAPLNIRVKVVEPGAALTGITSRVMDDMAALPRIPDYDPFVNHIAAVMAAGMANGLAGPDAIAAVIAQTVADDSDRLRYLAGDDFVTLLQTRRELGEETFLGNLRKQYIPH